MSNFLSDWVSVQFVCLFVFYVPSTARSFRDGTPIYCPLRFYCRQKMKPTERVLLECHLAHTPWFFHQSYCAVTMTGEVSLLDYITPIFIGLKSVRTNQFFNANCWKERSDFSSDQNSANNYRFSLKFFVYDKNICLCVLGIRSKVHECYLLQTGHRL